MKLYTPIKQFIFIALLLAACTKKDAGTITIKDAMAPVITIVSPSTNQQFSAGQNIYTTATATDNVKLTELHIHVINKASGVLLRDIHSYPDALSGTVQDVFPAQQGAAYTIKIIATDPSQNLSTSQVDVSVN